MTTTCVCLLHLIHLSHISRNACWCHHPHYHNKVSDKMQPYTIAISPPRLIPNRVESHVCLRPILFTHIDHLCSWLDWHQVGCKPLLKDIIMVVLCYKAHHSHFGSFTWTCSLSTIMYYGELSLMPSIILLWVTSTLSNSLGSHYSIDHHQVLKHYVSAMCSCWPRDGARAWSKYFCGACVVRLCSCELICFMWLHAHQFINAIFHSHLSYALGIYSWTASNK